MLKIKIILLIVCITLLTLFIGLANPTMHKQAMITDSNYKFVEETTETVPVKLTSTQTTAPTKSVETKLVDVKNSPIKTQTTSVKKVQTKVSEPKTTTPTKTVDIQTATTEEKSIETPPIIQIEPIQEPKTIEPKILTEQEEIIIWNKWRSDLQNQVMRDTKISAPMGTGFKFSFTVDKFGNMSNIKVWSTNNTYTDLAVRVIKPVLMSYQKKPILNFPEGTKRVITNVTGGFYISTITEYSTPSDYSDYEKVRK